MINKKSPNINKIRKGCNSHKDRYTFYQNSWESLLLFVLIIHVVFRICRYKPGRVSIMPKY